MKYAVLRISGKQYKVEEGKEILVDKLKNPKDLAYDILLYVDGAKVKIGKPTLKDVKVSLKVKEALEKGQKIDVYKFKAKSRYRKHTGIRPQYTRLLVESIA